MTKHKFSAIFHKTKETFILTITNEFLIPIAAMLPLMTGCAANKTFSPFREPPTGQTVNYPSDSGYNQYENGIDDTSYPTVKSNPDWQKGQNNRWHNLTEKELHNFKFFFIF